jgi:hypothetical protein
MNRPQSKKEINKDYVFNAIRKYNKLLKRPMARQQTYLDAVLSAVGIHAGLLPRSRAIAPSLKPEERHRVVCFLNRS